MKEFNLEEAKAGKPVCMRNGKDVRIICFDRKYKDYPIVSEDEEGVLRPHALNGAYAVDCPASDYDLFMKSEKRTGWINIYKNGYINRAHDTKEKADAIAGLGRIDCIKIEWEE